MVAATSPTEAKKARTRAEAAKVEANNRWSDVVEVSNKIDDLRRANQFSARLAELYRGD